MIMIDNPETDHLLSLDYLGSLHSLQEKLRLFERKYQISLDEFSAALKTSDQENFEAWDDIMERRAYRRVSQDLSEKIIRDSSSEY